MVDLADELGHLHPPYRLIVPLPLSMCIYVSLVHLSHNYLSRILLSIHSFALKNTKYIIHNVTYKQETTDYFQKRTLSTATLVFD